MNHGEPPGLRSTFAAWQWSCLCQVLRMGSSRFLEMFDFHLACRKVIRRKNRPLKSSKSPVSKRKPIEKPCIFSLYCQLLGGYGL